jgi:hypothetical protein
LALANPHDEEPNPYEAPRAEFAPPDAASLADALECERLRMPLLWAESAIRLASFECFLAGVVILSLFYFYTTDEGTVWPVFAAFMIVTFAIPAALGAGLWCFRAWARWGTALWLSLGAALLGWLTWQRFLPRTLALLILPPAFLTLAFLFSRTAATVCCRSYRIAVKNTPGLRRPRKLVFAAACVELTVAIVAIICGAVAFARP